MLAAKMVRFMVVSVLMVASTQGYRVVIDASSRHSHAVQVTDRAMRRCHRHSSGVTANSIPSAAVIVVDGTPTTNKPRKRANPPIATIPVRTWKIVARRSMRGIVPQNTKPIPSSSPDR